jgi:hypothetical protein
VSFMLLFDSHWGSFERGCIEFVVKCELAKVAISTVLLR